MTYSKELTNMARHIIWFEEPEEALSDKVRFLCYLMQYGDMEDVLRARKYFSDNDFKTALQNAYPGIMDGRSWAYWNLIYFDNPRSPMPKRNLTGS